MGRRADPPNPGNKKSFLKIYFFGENRHEASFYIKEQTKKKKIRNLTFKTTNLDPEKVRFWYLQKKKKKKNFLHVSALIQL